MADKVFTCHRCGTCCRGNGFVFLYPEDLAPLAAHLDLSLQSLIDRYTEFVILEIAEEDGGWQYLPYLVLKKNASHACLFLKDNHCSVHRVKPAQCRETPFVPEFFSDPAWRADLLKRCPGLQGITSESFPQPPDDRDERYLALLREQGYSLEKILGVTLPAPRIISATENS